jgi:uncharacterized membrane protein YwzB
MVLKILLELIILVALFFLGDSFWQLIKRDKFMRDAVNNKQLLDNFITKELFLNPPARVALYAKKNEIGWFMNIHVLLKSDRSTQTKMKTILIIIVLVLLAGSYILGWAFFAINSICFMLMTLFPISNSAKINALENILCLALILHHWRSENALECDQWIEQGRSLHKVYNSIKKVIDQMP